MLGVLLGGLITLLVALVFFYLTSKDLRKKLRPVADATELLLPHLHPVVDRAVVNLEDGALRLDYSVLGLAVALRDGAQKTYDGPHWPYVDGQMVKVLAYPSAEVVGEHPLNTVESVEVIRPTRHDKTDE